MGYLKTIGNALLGIGFILTLVLLFILTLCVLITLLPILVICLIYSAIRHRNSVECECSFFIALYFHDNPIHRVLYFIYAICFLFVYNLIRSIKNILSLSVYGAFKNLLAVFTIAIYGAFITPDNLYCYFCKKHLKMIKVQ